MSGLLVQSCLVFTSYDVYSDIRMLKCHSCEGVSYIVKYIIVVHLS